MSIDPLFLEALLGDPTFKAKNGFVIRRYTSTIDQDGMLTSTFEDLHAEGVVVPSGALGVVRGPEAEHQQGQITVYTEVPIQLGNAALGLLADNIIYGGYLYEVVDQDGYDEWGFNVATANLASPGGRPAP
jgi:hypothetical protein